MRLAHKRPSQTDREVAMVGHAAVHRPTGGDGACGRVGIHVRPRGQSPAYYCYRKNRIVGRDHHVAGSEDISTIAEAGSYSGLMPIFAATSRHCAISLAIRSRSCPGVLDRA
jgi:hypothetical protein